MPIKTVLFDAVGTLIYPQPDAAIAYAQAGRQHGFDLSDEQVQDRFRKTFADIDWSGPTSEDHERSRWRSVVGEVFRERTGNFDALFEQLWEHFGESSNWSLFPDVVETWTQLDEMGLGLGIASNFDARLLQVVAGLKTIRQAEQIFCSSKVGFSKPSAEFYQRVAQSLERQPHEILMVGDTWANDCQAPRAAGWQAVHLDRSADESAESIRSLRELVLHFENRGA